MLNFQIISNNLLVKDHLLLCERLKKLGKDFSFFAEARADHLKSEGYVLLKEAGFTTIQTGVESFSQHYLKKMNKGTRVIDNIAALKFCRENRIINRYNLIVGYPNEEDIDFEETNKTIKLFKQYLDPPQICYLRVLYGSPIQCNPELFNIDCFDFAVIDKIMYPKEFLEKGFNFIYEFKRKDSNNTDNMGRWARLVEDWRRERERLACEGAKNQNPVDQLVFYFVDGGSFLRIYDKRSAESIQVYTLDGTERAIFLSCVDIVSFQELQKRFLDIPEYQLAAILDTFEQSGIVYREDDLYLSLPLRYNLVTQETTKTAQNSLIVSA